MLKQLKRIAGLIGNTPLVQLQHKEAALYAKLEFANFSGSSKDRAAYSIIRNGIRSGKINNNTVVIASSSGNLAIALASICKLLGIKFIPIIDPNVNKDYEKYLSLISHKVVKVTEPDTTGGFLLTRIDTMNEMCASCPDSFCADQYSDPSNFKGYYPLGRELVQAFDKIDYIFVAVSSGGAITGISRSIKEKMPTVKVIAIDVEGSVIFGHPPRKRLISGIGSSQVPPILRYASIDDVQYVSQRDIVKGCMMLLNEQVVFGGASSGAVYLGAKRYLEERSGLSMPTAVLIFPDKGTGYLNTVYNSEWASILETTDNKPSLA